MPKIILSSNSRPETFKDLLLPTPAQAILYLLISPLLLALFNVQDIWHKLNTSLPFNHQTIQSGSKIQTGYSFWDTILDGRLPQIIFWLVVGVVIYIVLWFMRNIVNNIRNDLIADEFVHPKSYNRRRYWQSVLARKIFFAGLVLIFLVSIITFLKLVAIMADLSYTAVNEYSSRSLVVLASTFIASALIIHTLVVLVHVVANSWQAIYRDI